MAVIEVPDFKTAQDFLLWVESLDDKFIQSWKTKDWLAMYEKLTTLVDNDKSVEEDYRQYVKDLERMEQPEKLLMKKLRKWLNTPLKQLGKPDKINPIVLRYHFVNQEDNIAAFVKLYNNYRFEPQQFEAIRELAKESGRKMSEEQYIDLAGISGAMSDGFMHRENMLRAANKVDEIVKDNMDLPDEKSSRIIISKQKKMGSGDALNYDGKPRIRLGAAWMDAMLKVMFHESAHAHLQNSSTYQQKMLEEGLLPLKKYSQELDRDFYELMRYNMSFYLSWDKGDVYVQSLLADKVNMTAKEVADKKKEAFNGYKKQPNERFSNVFGIEAERVFRREHNQYSERNAALVRNFLEPLLGAPVSSKYVDGNIQIEYKSLLKGIDSKELIRRYNYLMDGADEGLLKEMNMREFDGKVVITVPRKHSFREPFLDIINKNYRKSSLIAYTRNKLAKKIDKTAAILGIESNLQDYKMSDRYKYTEFNISLKLEKKLRDIDNSRQQQQHSLKKAVKLIRKGIQITKDVIKQRLSKER